MISVKCDYCNKEFLDYPSNIKRHKKHHGRGLCDTCYHKVLLEGNLNDYKLTKKQI